MNNNATRANLCATISVKHSNGGLCDDFCDEKSTMPGAFDRAAYKADEITILKEKTTTNNNVCCSTVLYASVVVCSLWRVAILIFVLFETSRILLCRVCRGAALARGQQ